MQSPKNLSVRAMVPKAGLSQLAHTRMTGDIDPFTVLGDVRRSDCMWIIGLTDRSLARRRPAWDWVPPRSLSPWTVR